MSTSFDERFFFSVRGFPLSDAVAYLERRRGGLHSHPALKEEVALQRLHEGPSLAGMAREGENRTWEKRVLILCAACGTIMAWWGFV